MGDRARTAFQVFACNEGAVAADVAGSGTVIDPPSGRRPVPPTPVDAPHRYTGVRGLLMSRPSF
jgi:hypothetical protein